MPSAWTSFPCGTVVARWRYLESGRIEVEGQGVVLLKKAWPAAVTQWKDAGIVAQGQKYGVPVHFIAAIMAIESGGVTVSRSSAGALGIMQIMPATGRSLAKSLGIKLSSDDDLMNPNLSIELGTYYLSSLLRRYHGDFVAAATGYNAGSVKCLDGPTTCTKGYWGVCTDGSPYPLLAIQAANSALANGFPAPGSLPDLPKNPIGPLPLQPWIITATTAVGAFLAYKTYERAKQSLRRPQAGRRRPAYA